MKNRNVAPNNGVSLAWLNAMNVLHDKKQTHSSFIIVVYGEMWGGVGWGVVGWWGGAEADRMYK